MEIGNSEGGQSLIELLFAIGLAALLIPALSVGLIASREGKPQQLQRIDAVNYLKEAQEIIRSVREKGWNTFAVNGTYHPVLSGSSWSLVANSETINGFTRSIVISAVYRNTSGVIVTSPGPTDTLDPSTKKVVTTVSWTQPYSSSLDSSVYVTRYLDSLSYTETTQTQFNAGTKASTAVRATNPPLVSDDGEVVLVGGGLGDWCNPATPSGSLTEDLPKNGVAKTISAIEGRVFVGTGENSSGVSLADITGTDTNPPDPSVAGTVDGYKTNDVFIENPSYGYVATDTNSAEVVIVSISTHQVVGTLDTPGSTNADSIFVLGNTGYVTTGNTFYSFDVTNKSSIVVRDSVGLVGTGKSIFVVGTYAYVAVDNTGTQMEIIDVTDPYNISITGGHSHLNAQGGRDLFVSEDGKTTYIATGQSAQSEFFIVDTSSKNIDTPILGSYDTSPMDPKGITVVPGNRAIVVGYSGEEYQVVSTTNKSSLTRCGGLQVDTGINGVSGVKEQDGEVWANIVTDADPEFRIIGGGPGGQFSTSGTFESQTFEPPLTAAFNRLDVTFIKPLQTNITFQVAVADQVSGSCPSSGYTFVGPDGTSATFYTDDGPIALDDDGAGYENPGRCFRYKAFLSTTEQTQTPVLQEVTVVYSP